jgi:HK97 family phage prohead protease
MRANDKTGELKFRGRPWVYEQLSDDLGGWQEVIRPGAASRTLERSPDVRFLINHDANMLLARTASGTLSLSEDDEGGIADAHMADVSYARDLAELIDRGDLTQMSFGFWITNDSWSGNLHEVREFDLDGGDVSAVTFPAFPQTSVELRSAAKRELGSAFREAPTVDFSEDAVAAWLRSLVDADEPLLQSAFPELRVGKVLSGSNEELVRQAIEALTALVEKASSASSDDEDQSRSLERDLHRVRELSLLSQI